MSNPSFDNSKSKLQEHIRFIIAQLIREWQEENKVVIENIDVKLVNGSVEGVKIKIR